MKLPEHLSDLVVPQGSVGGVHDHDELYLGVGHVPGENIGTGVKKGGIIDRTQRRITG